MAKNVVVDAILKLPSSAITAGSSTVGEPSIGMHADQVLYTGNWFMARWMSRADDRITGAWFAEGKVGFMWSADKLAPKRPFPYVRAVIIDAKTFTVSSEPDIFSSDYAYAWPDAYPNPDGVVGVTLFRGGGKKYPGHVVGVLDGGAWRLKATVDGSSGPDDGKWGDYLTVRRRTSPDGAKWVATGFTLQGGGSVSDVQPIAVLFGVK